MAEQGPELDGMTLVKAVRALRKVGAVNEIALVSHLDGLARDGKLPPELDAEIERILPRYDLRQLIRKFLETADDSHKAWFLDGDAGLAAVLNAYLTPPPATTRPRMTQQEIATSHVRQLLASGMPLPSQREICRDLAAEHGGKFCPEQIHRAKKALGF